MVVPHRLRKIALSEQKSATRVKRAALILHHARQLARTSLRRWSKARLGR